MLALYPDDAKFNLRRAVWEKNKKNTSNDSQSVEVRCRTVYLVSSFTVSLLTQSVGPLVNKPTSRKVSLTAHKLWTRRHLQRAIKKL